MTNRTIAIIFGSVAGAAAIAGWALDTWREKTFDDSWSAPSFPVVLAPEDGFPMGRQLRDAVATFNKATCDLVSVDSERGTIAVRMMTVETIPGDKAASYFPDHGAIVVRSLTDTDEMYGGLFHEIGHVFQLVHDDVGGSIMNSPPQYKLTPKPTLTAKDAAAIKRRFCKKE
jgi:hypothetical protein